MIRLNKTKLWKAVVNKYHEGTGDPLSKSDLFHKVMSMIHDPWDQDPETDSDTEYAVHHDE